MEVIVSENKAELSKKVGEYVNNAVQSHKSKNPDKDFLVALSGGSAPKLLAAGLLQFKDSIDFRTWQVFLADERYVADDHPDSNLRACKEYFLNEVSIPERNIHGIDASIPLAAAATSYEDRLAKVSKTPKAGTDFPAFDLIILGMGPDGHTCSLFPGHKLLKEDKAWVAPISDSPKPPPSRVTLTYPVLNSAKNVFFLAAGDGKKDMLPKAIISTEELDKLGEGAVPAARVRPTNGNLVWFVDSAAAVNLSE
mmetsp:Transcript_3830/g.4646  ORF Transcript_3830/g.4646 Transcript_3830/m.4646 type:complete len:253 (-) Transcript_3830:1285-2043(-)